MSYGGIFINRVLPMLTIHRNGLLNKYLAIMIMREQIQKRLFISFDVAVTIKRSERGTKSIIPEKWDENEDRILPTRTSRYDRGLGKRRFRKDLKRLSFKLDRLSPTDSEYITEKNEFDSYYHGHMLIRTKLPFNTPVCSQTKVPIIIIEALSSHVEASSHQVESRWLEHPKINQVYGRTTDGNSGEVYFTRVFAQEYWLEYLGKTEHTLGQKEIFISKND